jgi:hypothetical protein
MNIKNKQIVALHTVGLSLSTTALILNHQAIVSDMTSGLILGSGFGFMILSLVMRKKQTARA